LRAAYAIPDGQVLIPVNCKIYYVGISHRRVHTRRGAAGVGSRTCAAWSSYARERSDITVPTTQKMLMIRDYWSATIGQNSNSVVRYILPNRPFRVGAGHLTKLLRYSPWNFLFRPIVLKNLLFEWRYWLLQANNYENFSPLHRHHSGRIRNRLTSCLSVVGDKRVRRLIPIPMV